MVDEASASAGGFFNDSFKVREGASLGARLCASPGSLLQIGPLHVSGLLCAQAVLQEAISRQGSQSLLEGQARASEE